MITIIIKNGKGRRHSTYQYRGQLKELGFKFNRESKSWIKTIEDENSKIAKDELKKIKKLCDRGKLTIIEKDSNYQRSNTYRNDYFKKHPYGIIGNYYQCVYCGKFIKKEKVSVDHLFPINRVEKGKYRNLWKKLLKLRGITNINQTENLVSACQSCNLQKSTKIKKWYLKGCIGRHFIYWVVIWLMLSSLTAASINTAIFFLK